MSRVVEWLNSVCPSLCAVQQRLRVRPDASHKAHYADKGDVYVNWCGRRRRLEIKQLMCRFTSADDYPYPQVLVTVCHAWDNAQPRPLAYMLTDKAAEHCMIVPGWTRPWWRRKQRYDSRIKRSRWYYETDLNRVVFVRMLRLAEDSDLDPCARSLADRVKRAGTLSSVRQDEGQQ